MDLRQIIGSCIDGGYINDLKAFRELFKAKYSLSLESRLNELKNIDKVYKEVFYEVQRHKSERGFHILNHNHKASVIIPLNDDDLAYELELDLYDELLNDCEDWLNSFVIDHTLKNNLKQKPKTLNELLNGKYDKLIQELKSDNLINENKDWLGDKLNKEVKRLGLLYTLGFRLHEELTKSTQKEIAEALSMEFKEEVTQAKISGVKKYKEEYKQYYDDLFEKVFNN